MAVQALPPRTFRACGDAQPPLLGEPSARRYMARYTRIFLVTCELFHSLADFLAGSIMKSRCEDHVRRLLGHHVDGADDKTLRIRPAGSVFVRDRAQCRALWWRKRVCGRRDRSLIATASSSATSTCRAPCRASARLAQSQSTTSARYTARRPISWGGPAAYSTSRRRDLIDERANNALFLDAISLNIRFTQDNQ
jgi:hypothetical protein